MRGGSNLPRVSDYNRVLVVDLIRRHPGISRVELAERTGLTGQSVSNICAHLVRQGLIAEDGRASFTGGRVRTVYRVVPSGRLAVGVHIDPARTVLALVDLAGQVIDRSAVPMGSAADPAAVIDDLAAATRSLVERNGFAVTALSGVGVAAPGPIDKAAGSIVGAPMLHGWDVVQIRDSLADRLGVTVELEKDTVAAATGELWAGTAPSDDFLFVYLGAGVGIGLVLDGEVAHGVSGNLGNFGHTVGDPDGVVCSCGVRGCIATSGAPYQLVEKGARAGAIAMPDDDSPAAVEAALHDLGDRARDGNHAAQEVIDYAARSFGRAVANLVNLLDIDAVVFGGPNWPVFQDTFLQIVPDVIGRLHLFGGIHDVRVMPSSLGEDVGPLGAAALIFAKVVTARPSLLVAPVGQG